jgi:hypothetical protein
LLERKAWSTTVWANIEYALKIADRDEKYPCGHMDANRRIGNFILAQGQDWMKNPGFTTGLYTICP